MVFRAIPLTTGHRTQAKTLSVSALLAMFHLALYKGGVLVRHRVAALDAWRRIVHHPLPFSLVQVRINQTVRHRNLLRHHPGGIALDQLGDDGLAQGAAVLFPVDVPFFGTRETVLMTAAIQGARVFDG